MSANSIFTVALIYFYWVIFPKVGWSHRPVVVSWGALTIVAPQKQDQWSEDQPSTGFQGKELRSHVLRDKRLGVGPKFFPWLSFL